MKIRSTLILFFGLCVCVTSAPNQAAAQSAVLSEIYGRGVHAYNSGQYDQASQWFSMAIDNGYRDPRAYYFRGLTAAASGRSYEAEGDFQMGAEIEARSGSHQIVGRSLARVQGSTRIKLEAIREKARLIALATGQARSNVRYGELGVAPTGPAPRNPAATQPRNITTPPAPAKDDPFADDLDQDPQVDSMDAFKDTLENAADEPAAASGAPEPTAGDPFGGGSEPASDPFGGGGGSDPFGASDAGADPFGGGDAGADPFGGDSPF
ncbi:hypothetical protein SAMN06265222_12169 [Neorhodopirellula lusitana]|uniref:Uncharacterized protein n=1 Tax=Neorhodopirellula lusitana TaxID=445327 RepID=A0ABY1QRB9_9BACT|nr:hypothetical protein [Neorhodopirellula lusitana]SMP76543.1 hypothetical protein SAMN06265222_12169 [Neorhodopirellula lusitana]